MVTIQAGQCGNQVGLQYWKQLAADHGINLDGSAQPYPQTETETQTTPLFARPDRPELFFSQNEQNTYTPRLILVDLEPLVVTKVTGEMPMFNQRNVHVCENGTGAANNWLQGYAYGQEHQEELMDLVDRELDKCGRPSAFQLFHSVAGGTGLGVGSLLLELLSERHPKMLVCTFSVFPLNEKTSDVVVQPYNTVLTLKRLAACADAVFVFDNDSLRALENKIFRYTQNAFVGPNRLIAHVAANVTNPLRFPGYMYNSYESLIAALAPTRHLKFLTSSLSPFCTADAPPQNRLAEYDIVLELLNDAYKMNRCPQPPTYIAALDYVIGRDINRLDVRRGLLKAQLRIPFVPWAPANVQVVHGNQSGFVSDTAVSGFQVSNNTSMTQMLGRIVQQYDLLAKRLAYINFYTKTNDPKERFEVLDMFNECRDAVVEVILEYKRSALETFEEEDAMDEDA